MSAPGTAREALIAEAIGDLARLLDRLDTLPLELAKSEQAFVQAAAEIRQQAGAAESRMAQIQGQLHALAMQRMAQRSSELTQQMLQTQHAAMTQVAENLFRSELEPTLTRLTAPLHRLLRHLDRAWVLWVSHGAAIGLSSAMTYLAVQSLRC